MLRYAHKGASNMELLLHFNEVSTQSGRTRKPDTLGHQTPVSQDTHITAGSIEPGHEQAAAALAHPKFLEALTNLRFRHSSHHVVPYARGSADHLEDNNSATLTAKLREDSHHDMNSAAEFWPRIESCAFTHHPELPCK